MSAIVDPVNVPRSVEPDETPLRLTRAVAIDEPTSVKTDASFRNVTRFATVVFLVAFESEASPIMIASPEATATEEPALASSRFSSAVLDVRPSNLLISEVVAVTPSSKFNSLTSSVAPSRMLISEAVAVTPVKSVGPIAIFAEPSKDTPAIVLAVVNAAAVVAAVAVAALPVVEAVRVCALIRAIRSLNNTFFVAFEASASPMMKASPVASVVVEPPEASRRFNSSLFAVKPDKMLISEVVAVTPSSKFSSAVVTVAPSNISNSASKIAAEPIVIPVAVTTPEEVIAPELIVPTPLMLLVESATVIPVACEPFAVPSDLMRTLSVPNALDAETALAPPPTAVRTEASFRKVTRSDMATCFIVPSSL